MTMATPASSSTSALPAPWASSPLAYFLAGMLVPTIAFYLSSRRTQRSRSRSVGLEDGSDSDSDGDDGFAPNDGDDPSASWGIADAPYKMVLCVNTSLGMGKGKIAAQCGHAAVGCYKRSRRQCPAALSAWERTGCAKIAVKCPSEDEMGTILEEAARRGIPSYFVEDAGRTQIAAGSRTVLGLGPAPVRAFEGVTSHLKLM